jgi:nitrogen PTS system EIIA component
MDIADLLSPEAVIADLRAKSKKQALQELADRAGAVLGLDAHAVFDVLLERERLGPTAIGGGIAIPHGKLRELDRVHGLFAHLAEPINLDAIDDQPVDLVFVLLAPDNAGGDHLKALARVSRLLRDKLVCQRLRSTHQRDALYAILTGARESSAA